MTWKSQTKANAQKKCERKKAGKYERGIGEGEEAGEAGKAEKYGHKKCTTTWQTETIAMTEQMFSSCPRGGKPR